MSHACSRAQNVVRMPIAKLRPGELLDVVRGQLRVIAYEDVYVDTPKPAMVQRICAVRGEGRP